VEKFSQSQVSEQAKGQFLAAMSREIQNAMTNVLKHSDFVKKTGLSAEQIEHVDAISANAQRLSWIVNDILDFCRLEIGNIELQSIEFNLEYLINDIFKKGIEQKKDRPIDTYIDIDKNVPLNLIGDPTRFRQVLANLLSNAFKFTLEGQIGIIVRLANLDKVEQAGKVPLRIIIKDSGEGIPQTKMESIFEFQTHSDLSKSWEYGGTGLGLSMCKLVVEAMEGTITIHSEEEKGSEFILMLPFQKGESPAQTCIYPLTREELVGKKAIIVDDNEIARKILNKCCQTMGIKPLLLSASPKAVLQMLDDLSEAGETPDLILCDIMMPEMDGYELARRIRANEKYKDIKMIAVTSAMRVGEARNAQKSGFNGFLPKPVFLDELAKVIATVLGDQRSDGSIVTRHMAEELNLKGTKILAVASIPSDQKSIEDCCVAIGCQIRSVSTNTEVLEVLSSEPWDLCLIDSQMFSENADIVRAIKDMGGDLPLVVMVSGELKDERSHFLGLGIDDVLGKPIDMIGLKRVIMCYRKGTS